MAFKRQTLKAMGLEDETVQSIMDLHTEVVDGLKAEIEKVKAKAEALPDIQKKLEKAEADLEVAKKDSYKVKYEALKEEHEEYVAKVEKKQTHEAKEAAYRDLLKQAGVNEKRIASVLKVSDVDSVELDSDGKIKGSDDLIKGIKTEWADFIVSVQQKGAKVPNPPADTGGKATTKEEIMKIRDPVARQNAIGQNLDLFTHRKE